MDKIIDIYMLTDINKITKNINTTYSAYSQKFDKKVFIKIFGEEEKFIKEKKIAQHLESYSGYLDSYDNQTKCIIYEYRDYKDVELCKENIGKIAELLSEFHKNSIFKEEKNKKLSDKIIDSYKVVISEFKDDVKLKKIYNLIRPYFTIINLEEQKQPKVMLHGDFGLRNVKEYLGKMHLIDFERASSGNFWTDLNKFLNRDLVNKVDKKTFLDIYMKNMSGLSLPTSLYYIAQLYYSALGIYKYNIKVFDKEFLALAKSMIDKIERYLESNQVFNCLLGLCIGDAMGIACTHYTSKEILSIYNGKVKSIIKKKLRNDKLLKYDKGEITDDSMQNIALLMSYNLIKKFDRNHQALCLMSLDDKYIKPTTISGSLKILNNLNNISWRGRGNGALIRGVALGIIAFLENWNSEKLINNVVTSITLTHNTYEALGGAICITKLVSSLLSSNDFTAAYNQSIEVLEIYENEQSNYLLSNNIKLINEIGITKYIDDLKKEGDWGFVVSESLPVILFLLNKGLKLKDALIYTINLGGDSDSIGSVVGAISAIIYGTDDVAKEISIISKKNDLLFYDLLLIVDSLTNRGSLIYE